MPKLWSETIESHRREVRDAILDATARLAAHHGVLSVTMSEIAEQTGIGRATLYKYFRDVESILLAWHDRQISNHLEQLIALSEGPGDAGERIEAVLTAFAFIARESHGHHNAEVVAFLHRDEQVARAEHRLRDLIAGLLNEGVRAGQVRVDVPVHELVTYCLRALTAAGGITSKAGVERLVAVTLDGLRPRR